MGSPKSCIPILVLLALDMSIITTTSAGKSDRRTETEVRAMYESWLAKHGKIVQRTEQEGIWRRPPIAAPRRRIPSAVERWLPEMVVVAVRCTVREETVSWGGKLLRVRGSTKVRVVEPSRINKK
ncbi:hypothetical protein RHMOL_Rhmol03G0180300 [Rhododendron molle]|uniref:Uncharacterized protein n=1 Tax=Rhododendron molle TaxID=49168 RepID=A0ACC0PH00_RHOML|nr:hypothetical protein RHMOL_Rhmol03G0180300 [Rhododendron molle]